MSDGNDGADGRNEPAALNVEARVAQAERVAGAINVVKWIVILAIALGTVAVALMAGFGSLGSEEAATVESATLSVDGSGPYDDYVESEPAEPDGPGAATRFLYAVLVLAGGGLQALLVWIAFGWAQHTLGMLAVLARRRVS